MDVISTLEVTVFVACIVTKPSSYQKKNFDSEHYADEALTTTVGVL